MNNPSVDNRIKENNYHFVSLALNWLKYGLSHHIDADDISTEDVTQTYEQMIEGGQINPPPNFLTLSQKFQLTEFEQNILLLCVAVELNPIFSTLYSQANKNDKITYPTLGLAFSLFNYTNWEAISPESPLRYWGLVELININTENLITSPLKANERIIHFILGSNYLDPRLKSVLKPFFVPRNKQLDPAISDSQTKIQDRILNELKNDLQSAEIPHLYLLGSNLLVKERIVKQVCQQLDLSLFILKVEHLPTNSQDLESFIRLYQRESRLLSLALYINIQVLDNEPSNSIKYMALQDFLQSCQGVVFINSQENLQQFPHPKLIFDITKPTPEEQFQFWGQSLGKKNEQYSQILTSQFNLNLIDIQNVITSIQPPIKKGAKINGKFQSLWQGCLAHSVPKMEQLAQRIELKATWDDIVLPEAIKEQL
ncbi:MAG TPA: hypothetical protein DCF68_17190, partial [Cyanothece sp. UBA12306]|nr:hypothetical protein [Cyanothece sp. UBA12306]